MVDIAYSYNTNHSTTGAILKNKDKIMGRMKSAVLMMQTIIPNKCGKVMGEMEKLLCVWLQDQCQCQVPLSLMLIQQEAQCLYEDLKKKLSEESDSIF